MVESAEAGNVQNGKQRKVKNRPGIEPNVDEQGGSDASQSPFIRALGSTDYITRRKGITALSRFLQLRAESLNESDLLKIWKGLYVCFWHSDKTPVQVILSVKLSESVQPSVSSNMRGGTLSVCRHLTDLHLPN
jgi:ribosomal RNA-processing protein 1